MPATLEIRALTKRLHAGVPGCAASALVLRDVWLRVGAGERVAVCGTDAAARTALLLCAAGLMRPDAGLVRASGVAAYVAADSPALGGLTVAEMLEWHRRSLLARGAWPEPASPLQPANALRLVGCEALSDVRVRLLSPASARRVALARALVARPALLAVDGPAARQPADAWREVDRALERAAAAGVAVLFAAPTGASLGSGVRAVWLRDRTVERAVLRRARRGAAGGAPAAARRAVAEPAAPTA